MRKITLNEIELKEIIKLYTQDLMGSDAIFQQTGIGKKIILNTLKENNIVLRNSGRQDLGGKIISDKKWRDNNKEYVSNNHKSWSKQNRAYLREYHKKWREENINHLRLTRNNYEKTRKHNDPIYKLIGNFRTAIYTVLKENNVKKYGHYFEILGYTPNQLIDRLESQFTGDMSWDNYGTWHVDHKLPITSFTFTDINDIEFKKCWSLGNLQPMWGEENIRKSNKIF